MADTFLNTNRTGMATSNVQENINQTEGIRRGIKKLESEIKK